MDRTLTRGEKGFTLEVWRAILRNQFLFNKESTMLIDDIAKDRMNYRRESDREVEFNLLTSLYSDLMLEQKEHGDEKLPDEKVLSVLNRYKKNIEENLKLVSDEFSQTEMKKELDCILGYLPRQLTTEELTGIIKAARDEGMNNIGQIMGMLKEQYNGQYNPKEASTIAKELLS
jgi:hypothetical protein